MSTECEKELARRQSDFYKTKRHMVAEYRQNIESLEKELRAYKDGFDRIASAYDLLEHQHVKLQSGFDDLYTLNQKLLDIVSLPVFKDFVKHSGIKI